MAFKVKEVVDGDTFKVTPNWKWNDEIGDTVRPIGYDTPEKGESGFEQAKQKLTKLIDGKEVELKNPIKLTYGRLLCNVYINGKNLKDFFEEYQ